ncbi:MAG: phosphopantetheine-binding protein [Methanosarcina sp.]
MEKNNVEEIRELVLDYVMHEYIDDEDVKINYDTPLISGGYVDSFSMITLLVYLEKKFLIRIPSSKATPDAFNSINKIADLVIQHLN